MSPRKSNTLVTASGDATMETEEQTTASEPKVAKGPGRKKKEESASSPAEQTPMGIEEFMMPRMMILRLAKGVLPPSSTIHRDAATSLQYATSVFLNHVAAAANEHTLAAQRKNISPHDMLLGLKDTEWGSLVPQLEDDLAFYVRQINDKRNEYRRKLKQRGSLGGASTSAGVGNETSMTEDSIEAAVDLGDQEAGSEVTLGKKAMAKPRTSKSTGDGERKAKKVRLSEGVPDAGDDEEIDEDGQEDDEEEEEGEEEEDDEAEEEEQEEEDDEEEVEEEEDAEEEDEEDDEDESEKGDPDETDDDATEEDEPSSDRGGGGGGGGAAAADTGGGSADESE